MLFVLLSNRVCFHKSFGERLAILENCDGCSFNCPEGTFVQIDSTDNLKTLGIAELEVFGDPIERSEIIISL